VKTITIAGNIGKDAVIRSTQNGDKVTSWTIAVEDRKGSEKSTLWFSASMWGKRGESLAQFLTKGTKVVVSGDLSTREHDGKTYLEVRADQVTLMGGGDRSEPRQEQQTTRRDDDTDSIPF
jgi:single-strand DNA-binding protein